MHVDIIDRLENLAELRADWEAVSAADPEAQIFMSWAWISGWLQQLGTQWIVLAAKEAPGSSTYCGFLPLQLRTLWGSDGQLYNELRLAGSTFAGYNGFICDPALEPEVTEAFCTTIKSLAWGQLHLENVFLSPSRLALFLSQFPASQFSSGRVERIGDGDGIDHDIYVFVDLPSDWESFLGERMGAATRKTARKTLRQIDDEGEYRVTHVTAQSLEHDLKVLLDLWEIQWAEKLTAQHNAQLPRILMNNFRHMLRYCFSQGVLFLPVLWQGDKPIAAQGSLIDHKNRSLVGLLNGRDLSVRKPAPGFSLHLFSVRWAIENDFQVYDLQTGDFSYKYDFGGQERRVECLAVSTPDRRNPGGRLEPRALATAFSRCRASYGTGRLKEATAGCRQILDIDADHAGALQLLDEIESLRATNIDRGFKLAAELHQKGHLSDAESIYRRILDKEPTHFEAANLLGIILLQQDRFEAADAQFAEAIALKPEAAGPHYHRGLTKLKLNRLSGALRHFETAVALNPDDDKAVAIRDRLLDMLSSGGTRERPAAPAAPAP